MRKEMYVVGALLEEERKCKLATLLPPSPQLLCVLSAPNLGQLEEIIQRNEWAKVTQ